MKNIFRGVIVILLLALVIGCAGRTKPVYNIESNPISYELTKQDVERAILKAGVEKGWTMNVVKPGEIDAKVIVRSHNAHIKISYSEKNYSIHYVDSQNLLYKDGKIHRNYNKWISFLDRRIQANLIDISAK